MTRLRSALETIAHALETAQPLPAMIAQLEAGLSRALHPACIAICLDDEGTHALGIGIPLRVNGSEIGLLRALCADDALDANVEDTLRLLAAPLAAAIALRRGSENFRDDPPATIDALCRIANRRGFDEHLHGAWERARLKGVPLVVALADVDFFKAYNDRYGHIAGDRCLQQIASLLARRRDADDGFAARYGGEEFVLVFEKSTVERVIAEMQLIFDRLAALDVEHAGTTLGRVSLSVGVAAATPSAGRSPLGLVEEADRALYGAKRLGRNRIATGTFVSSGPIVARLHHRRTAFCTNVPTFGRGDDLARVLAALRHARMLTLVGPSGIGKSRLLALVADEAASRLHRPVVFVEAELLRADVDPVTALASACDLTLDARAVLETVTDALDEREAIVVLDGIDPGREDIRALCGHLCASAPRASIVAAAPTPLGIAAERTMVIPPIGDEAALQLLAFHGVDPGTVSRDVVRRLGGNPASITAAAGWIAELGLETVIGRFATQGGVYSDPADLRVLFAANAEARRVRA